MSASFLNRLFFHFIYPWTKWRLQHSCKHTPIPWLHLQLNKLLRMAMHPFSLALTPNLSPFQWLPRLVRHKLHSHKRNSNGAILTWIPQQSLLPLSSRVQTSIKLARIWLTRLYWQVECTLALRKDRTSLISQMSQSTKIPVNCSNSNNSQTTRMALITTITLCLLPTDCTLFQLSLKPRQHLYNCNKTIQILSNTIISCRTAREKPFIASVEVEATAKERTTLQWWLNSAQLLQQLPPLIVLLLICWVLQLKWILHSLLLFQRFLIILIMVLVNLHQTARILLSHSQSSKTHRIWWNRTFLLLHLQHQYQHLCLKNNNNSNNSNNNNNNNPVKSPNYL